MLDVNLLMEQRLQAAGVTCPACEEPAAENAGDGPYITWRQAAVEAIRASGNVWANSYRIPLTIWSTLCVRPESHEETQRVIEQVFSAFDFVGEDGVRCYVSMANLQGKYIPQVDRRAYEMIVTVRGVGRETNLP